MLRWTAWMLTLVLVGMPATGALADGEFGRSARLRQMAEAGVDTSAGRPMGRVATPAAELDTTAVDELRAADADDLSINQIEMLAREVARMKSLRAKAEADGEISDGDAERLYRNAVLSCTKVMRPGQDRRAVQRTTVNRGSSRRAR